MKYSAGDNSYIPKATGMVMSILGKCHLQGCGGAIIKYDGPMYCDTCGQLYEKNPDAPPPKINRYVQIVDPRKE